ncbi:hypothetical protein ACHAXR_012946 [Thalassiosira sp. AJA248-18]
MVLILSRYFRPIITIYAVLLAGCIPSGTVNARDNELRELETSTRRLELAVLNSDQYAESVLTVEAPKPLGIGYHEHARITSILSRTKEMVDTARELVQNEKTLEEGREMLEQATSMFYDVKDHIKKHQNKVQDQALSEEGEHREMLRKKYSEHDIRKAAEDEKRALDVARTMYETMITFPECVGQLHEDCLEIINGELASLGLSTIEVVTREKRNADQEGYNKVVIITNELADRVDGRSGDGFVTYPFMWNDSQQGQRMLGVDGKWNCLNFSPEDCCNSIKESVPHPDIHGNEIECHIFVPFGGLGNPRRNDRVFIILSPDGRVHEPPIIQ